jgi:LysM repeat protein
MSDESNQASTNTEQTRPNDSPARETPSEQPAQTVVVREAESEQRGSNLGEFIKFGILAVILLGTPLVIALLIPFIFGQIVPTVLGSNLPTDTPTAVIDEVVEPDMVGTPDVTQPGGSETGTGGEVTPDAAPTIQEAVTSEVLVHLVRTGETLASIARQYGVTAEEIAAANDIQNPNQIFVGTVLIIPQPAAP